MTNYYLKPKYEKRKTTSTVCDYCNYRKVRTINYWLELYDGDNLNICPKCHNMKKDNEFPNIIYFDWENNPYE